MSPETDPSRNQAANPYETPIQAQAVPANLESLHGVGVDRSPRQWKAYLRRQVRRSQRRAVILQNAVNQGLSPGEAQAMLDEVIGQVRKSGFLTLTIGVVMAVVGTAATTLSFLAGQNRPDGFFVIWWGPVVFGAIIGIVGLVRLAKVPTN